jgi:Rrf2 family protein
MVHLASVPPGQKLPLNVLAEATGVRESFLSKILQRLVHQGMLLSHRGSGGGFILNRAPDQVTLLDVVEAIEGPTQLNRCVGESGRCNRKDFCSVHATWGRAQRVLTQLLGGVSVAQLAVDPSRPLDEQSTASLSVDTSVAAE